MERNEADRIVAQRAAEQRRLNRKSDLEVVPRAPRVPHKMQAQIDEVLRAAERVLALLAEKGYPNVIEVSGTLNGRKRWIRLGWRTHHVTRAGWTLDDTSHTNQFDQYVSSYVYLLSDGSFVHNGHIFKFDEMDPRMGMWYDWYYDSHVTFERLLEALQRMERELEG